MYLNFLDDFLERLYLFFFLDRCLDLFCRDELELVSFVFILVNIYVGGKYWGWIRSFRVVRVWVYIVVILVLIFFCFVRKGIYEIVLVWMLDEEFFVIVFL